MVSSLESEVPIMAKVQISIDDDLLSMIDKMADSMYMSRSGFVSYSCVQVINSNAAMLAITEVSLALRKISDTGEISDEDRKKLDDFENLVKLFSGKK